MPSPLTSSFASAAANNNPDGRRGGDAGADWARNRANGATQTFRRPSLATNPSYSRDSNHGGQGNTTPISGGYLPPYPHANQQTSSLRNGVSGDLRYTKDHLIALYKQQRDMGAIDHNLSAIFTGGWDPLDGGESSSAAWGRNDEGKEPSVGLEICWNPGATTEPLALIKLSDEEYELFSSVNSPIKPLHNTPKDNTGNATLGRKTSTSISQNHMVSHSTASPGTGRPGLRRRETSESYNANNPLSAARFFRDESSTAPPPASLLQRKTDLKENTSETKNENNEKDAMARDGREESSSPFGSLKRSNTGPLTGGLIVPSSPWAAGPPSAGFGSMGTFGSFALGPPSAPLNDFPEQRSGFGSMRGESRFKGLLSKTSSEDMSPAVKERSSVSNLGRLPEVENDVGHQTWDDSVRTRPRRSDTNPYGDDVPRAGSATIAGAQDDGQRTDQLGMAAFGLPSNIGARDTMPPSANQNLTYHQTPQSRQRSQEPMSPTDTNPYQSPEADRNANADLDQSTNRTQQPGDFGFGGRDEPGATMPSSLQRGVSSAIDDRNQTSSIGPSRGFGGLGGIGGFPGFGNSAWSGSTGTPRGFAAGFGDSVFSMAELQSPSVPALGSNTFFGSPPAQNAASANRPSKIGSLFSHAMQDPLRAERVGGDGLDRQPEFAQRGRGISALDGTFARREQEAHLRGMSGLLGGTDSQEKKVRPVHTTEDSGFVDGLGSYPPIPGFGSPQVPITSPGLAQIIDSNVAGDIAGTQAGRNMSQSSGSPASSQLPAPQQRQMVMPDRMRWIYRDPSGMTQGPWSGLEMHDWFKAGFFTAELQVKKLEDTDYEPLAQLVRRIGNSREPFLVPQIGVPHGPAAPSQGNHWAAQSGSSTVGAGPPQPGAAQPPFASSFPSFGTTLTAEQQNALERRKQEEQYLMARQKEHLAQQQVLLKQMQLQGGPHSLHSLQHHSSAHSLHSQPSLGSITSPSGFQPSPIQGPIQPPPNGQILMEGNLRQPLPGQYGTDFRGARDEDLPNLLDRMNVSRGAPFSGSGAFGQYQDNGQAAGQTASILQDRARLQMEQQEADSKAQSDAFRHGQGFSERLLEFNVLRAQMEDNETLMSREVTSRPSVGAPGQRALEQRSRQEQQQTMSRDSAQGARDAEALSLSQQVHKTAATMGQQPAAAAEETSWNRLDVALPPFLPPLPTASPLPAPSAQRSRQNVADNLVVESRSQTETPVDTPSTSIAPWAEKTSESTKGPSLKEIQEAEARKAARLEEIATAARKVQAEQERLVHPILPAQGLPPTSTWATAGTPTTPTTPGANVWAKAAVGKISSATADVTATKKTLAQIQREEESRKQRQAAAIKQPANNQAPSAAAGKRYADLASKVATAVPGGVWTTVGSGGKIKAPTTVLATPTPTPQLGGRVGSVPAPTPPRPRPSLQTRYSSMATAQSKATDDFARWAKTALGKGLNSNINVDDFVKSLLLLPLEAEIISDSIYANSETLDGRRFAEEFIRRRKLADKGVLQDGSVTPGLAATPVSEGGKSAGNGAGGGWNEVAKKGPVGAAEAKDESDPAAFKVVATKKKGKR